MAAVLVAGFIFTQITNYYFPTTGEKKLETENKQIQYDYAYLKDEMEQLKIQMREIEDRDNEIYRTITKQNVEHPEPSPFMNELTQSRKHAACQHRNNVTHKYRFE
jgi:hypothetical protein